MVGELAREQADQASLLGLMAGLDPRGRRLRV
jgi:hypothetical protein